MWNIESVSDSFRPLASINSAKVVRNDAVAALIHTILSDFRARGVRVSPSSRLHQYASLFESSLSGICDESLHSKLDVALLEALQFEAIRRSLGNTLDSALVGDISTATG